MPAAPRQCAECTTSQQERLNMSDNAMTTDTIKDMVRARYGDIAARADSSCCAPAATTACCAPAAAPDLNAKARDIGYSDEELAAVPEGANLGLGCGNPLAIAAMKAGEVVVDLGSGAGFDCLLAARQVGATGTRDRHRYDARDAQEGARERAQGWRRQCGIPARRARTPADRRRYSRCDHLELRDQSGAG